MISVLMDMGQRGIFVSNKYHSSFWIFITMNFSIGGTYPENVVYEIHNRPDIQILTRWNIYSIQYIVLL